MSKPSAERLHRTALCGLLLAATVLSGCGTLGGAPSGASASAPVSGQVSEAYAKALTAMKNADWASAETELKALVDDHPELPGPAVNLGIVYGHLNRPADARKILESAASRWPDFAPGQHQLGRLLSAQGEFEAADAAYARALATDPNYVLAYYDRAVLNEIYLQRLPVALQNYEKFQQLQPIADEQVARWIADLRRRTEAAQPAGKPAAKGEPTS